MTTIALALQKELVQLRNEAIESYFIRPNPQTFLKTLSRHVDTVLIRAWRATGMSSRNALVAVGGYGRGELFPCSDVDLLILLQNKPTDVEQIVLENFIQTIWSLGLTIGHSVRTVSECLKESKENITVQTSLLEARYVTGSRALFRKLSKQYNQQMDAPAFFTAKWLEMRQRHLKFDDTPYSLEPNCKEGPGGLRDLQMILWSAKAANLGKSWTELAKNGLITVSEASQLKKKEKAFKDIRIRLHIEAQRCEDRLLFDLQMPIAQTFAFKKNGVLLEKRQASEQMMQRYYRAAHTVVQLNMILLQNLKARLFPSDTTPIRLNHRFNEVNGLIDIANSRIFLKYPSAMLEVFYLLSQRSDLKNMTAKTLRALWHARVNIDKAFRLNPTHHSYFLRILKSKQFAARALQHMNELGILGRYLPNFEKVVGQMQHDLFHQYTVDQHILNVITRLHRFSESSFAHENPFCAQLMAGFEKPWLLYVAALFHDIAKGRGGDHATKGVGDAQAFCKMHNISPKDTDLILFLVKEHITLSEYAQKKDFSSPDVLREFAAIVKNERRLTALYLLTVADIQGTNIQIWNSWKSQLFESLFKNTLRVLGGEDITVAHEIKQRKEQAMARLSLAGLQKAAYDDFWAQLNIVYFLRHNDFDIAWQTKRLCHFVNTNEPIVFCRQLAKGDNIQVSVYLRDQSDLFARICCYFERKQFSVLDAKIHTTSNGYALDTFLIYSASFKNDSLDWIDIIEKELTADLMHQKVLPDPLPKQVSRKSRVFPITPSVDLVPDASKRMYVLSISANDRTGLLYEIARLFSQYEVNLHTAKIMTLGERIEDVFLIDGKRLDNPKEQIQFERDMFEILKVD